MLKHFAENVFSAKKDMSIIVQIKMAVGRSVAG